MKWNYKTNPDFEWPKQNEKVLLADFNGAAWVSYFNGVDIDIVEAWAKIEPPKKKRWRPTKYELYFFIDDDGYVDFNNNCAPCTNLLEGRRSCFGVYKTKEEAEIMRDKIKDFVTKEIGEV